MIRTSLSRILAVAALGVLGGVDQQAAEVKRLTLTEAVHVAVSQNRDLKIARLRVTESEQRKAGARSSYFPEQDEDIQRGNALKISAINNQVSFLQNSDAFLLIGRALAAYLFLIVCTRPSTISLRPKEKTS